MHKNTDILEIVYDKMRIDAAFCRAVINLKVQVEDSDLPLDDDIVIWCLPEEVCGLNSMFLAVKYNPEATEKMTQIATSHGIMEKVLEDQVTLQKETLFQLATKNKTTECLR